MPLPPENLRASFSAAFGNDPDFFVRAPGRADLLGSHTDYNKGWVLPLAIDREVWLAVRATPGNEATIRTLDFNEEVTFDLGDSAYFDSLPVWARYAAGVARSLREEHIDILGCQMMLQSTIPVGAGLSSSAAVEMAYALAWTHLAGVNVERMRLAKLCQRAENEFVGVNSGLMDQFASLFGQQNRVLLFDTRTLEWESLPLPGDVVLVIADSATSRELASSAYNTRVSECQSAVSALQTVMPEITALRDVAPEQMEEYQQMILEPARQRAHHVVRENQRVLDAAQALKASDMTRLGRLMDDSFLSMRDLFEASRDELNVMWRLAHGHPARLGGRILGAGWGGCMIFLVWKDKADSFIDHLGRQYQAQTRLTPSIFTVSPADGASIH